MRRLATPAMLVMLVAAALSACGDDDGQATDAGSSSAATDTPTGPSDDASDDVTDSPSSSGAPSGDATGLPACDEVWVDGARLPGRYRGCTTDGAVVKPEVHRCSSGQRLVTHADTFWAVAGAKIHETDGLKSDAAFKEAKLACLA
jgi:hypothetical protein